MTGNLQINTATTILKETVGWATTDRNVFPLPFGRGEGQGEGIHENMPIDRSFPLTPALSPSAGERENRKTASAFCRPPHGLLRKGQAKSGAVLVEVILALVLFAAAAVVIGAGMHSAIEGVTRQKLNLHAVNLAVSVLSEIQMGFRSVESLGPETFESPFDHWTWQLILTPTETDAAETSDLTRVEIIVRHDDPAVVHRLTQILKLEKKTEVPITATPVAQP